VHCICESFSYTLRKDILKERYACEYSTTSARSNNSIFLSGILVEYLYSKNMLFQKQFNSKNYCNHFCTEQRIDKIMLILVSIL
jgi:hypothetical protein